MNALRTGPLAVRSFAAVALVSALATASYLVLLPFVLASAEQYAAMLGAALLGSLAMFALLALQCALLIPTLGRLIEACRAMEAPDPFDREAIYAAPRRAASLVALFGLAVLALGYVPIDGHVGQERTLGTNVAAVCVALAAGVLYAVVRLALRPLVEALRDDPHSQWDLEGGGAPPADRLASRVAIGIAVPASAAALLATLMVTAHLVAISNDEEQTAREIFNQALHVERRPGESMGGLEVAASALRGAGVSVHRSGDTFSVLPEPAAPPSPPFWSIPIAVMVALIAGQIGRRIGQNASIDVETAARRMSVVGARDIRSVTMSMARPRSVPEIREMALALDTLAATLLRMAEDQKRALTVRTEAAKVRSFVLASVSHDLRGPLNSVLGFGELLLSGVEGPLTDGQRESLDALCRGGRDLLRLVGDLLDHARIDAGRMTIERSRVSVDAVVELARVAAIERSKSPVKTDEIAIEGEAGLQLVADEERLGHAVGALAAFALLRPGSDGRVVIRMRRDGDRVALTIRGGGTTPQRDALARMFEPFDFAPSGARAPAGLNLAVSVARGIVRLHGGGVSAEPIDEGGVSLSLSLPALG